MGIKDFLEEAAGALAAEKGLEALDPNAGILEKGVAAFAGFEGVGMVKEHFAAGDAEQAPASEQQDAPADDAEPADDTQSDDSQNA